MNKEKISIRPAGLTIERRKRNVHPGSCVDEIRYANIQSPHSTEYSSSPTTDTAENSTCE